MKKIIPLALLALVGCGGQTATQTTTLPADPAAANSAEADRMCEAANRGEYANVSPGQQINIRIGDNPYGLVCVIPQ